MWLALSRHAAQRSLEKGLVDPSVKDGNAHLHTLADHLLLLHVKLLGKLGRRQVIGHGGPPLSLKSGRGIFTPAAGRCQPIPCILRGSMQPAKRDNAAVPATVENEGANPASLPIPRKG